jgi:hypothetical protein
MLVPSPGYSPRYKSEFIIMPRTENVPAAGADALSFYVGSDLVVTQHYTGPPTQEVGRYLWC